MLWKTKVISFSAYRICALLFKSFKVVSSAGWLTTNELSLTFNGWMFWLSFERIANNSARLTNPGEYLFLCQCTLMFWMARKLNLYNNLIMFIHFSPKPNRSNVIMINVWPCRRPCKSLNQNDSIISCLKPIKSNTNLMLLLCIDLSLRKLDWVSLIISVKPSLNLRSHK